MRFRRALIFGLPLLLLACGSNKLVFDLEVSEEALHQQSYLTLATSRVIERRLANMGETATEIDIQTSGEAPQLHIELENKEIVPILKDLILEDFVVKIMKLVDREEAEHVVAGVDGYTSTGIDNDEVLWLAAAEEENERGRVKIIFTDEGRQMMSDLFRENNGGYIGLFVRETLVAKLLVDTDELKDDIIISEIPSVELAHAFADDVNVGLHVNFLPHE